MPGLPEVSGNQSEAKHVLRQNMAGATKCED